MGSHLKIKSDVRYEKLSRLVKLLSQLVERHLKSEIQIVILTTFMPLLPRIGYEAKVGANCLLFFFEGYS